MIDMEQINRLHRDACRRWHDGEIDNPHEGLLGAVCELHARNFRLWHEEDVARCPSATDAQVAETKRAIDRLNGQRHAWIEKFDELLARDLRERGVRPPAEAPQNTETPGSAVDRLSVLSLRLHHLEEIASEDTADVERRGETRDRLAICRQQHRDLTEAMTRLLEDLSAGRLRLTPYRSGKMYDDPAYNPHLRDG